MAKVGLWAGVLVALLSVAGHAGKRIDFGVGGCFYGDSIGVALNAGFYPSISDWVGLFKKTPPSGKFVEQFYAGAGLHVDLVPLEFALYTVDFELGAFYEIKLSDLAPSVKLPLSFSPYLTLGVPVNVFKHTESLTRSGFMTVLGLKAGYSFGNFQTGLGVEYKMNFTVQYVGSVGLYAYAAYLLP